MTLLKNLSKGRGGALLVALVRETETHYCDRYTKILLSPLFISEGIQSAYATTSPMLMFCQGLMILEIVHSAIGLVKSGIMTVFLQVCVLVIDIVFISLSTII